MLHGNADRVQQDAVNAETATFLADLDKQTRRIEAARTALSQFREVMRWHVEDALADKLSGQLMADITAELESNINKILR